MSPARTAMDTLSNIEHLFGRAKAFLDLCPPIPGLVSPPKGGEGKGGEGGEDGENLEDQTLRCVFVCVCVREREYVGAFEH